MDPKLLEQLFDKGPLGLCVLLTLVVIGLYRKNDALQTKLFEYAAKMASDNRSALTENSGAVAGLTKTLERAVEASDERFETMKSLQMQSAGTAQLISANGEGIKGVGESLRDGFNQLREDLRQVTRDQISRERRS